MKGSKRLVRVPPIKVRRWNIRSGADVVLAGPRGACTEFAMSDVLALQFEVIRMIAASLIAVAIVLLWVVVMTRQ